MPTGDDASQFRRLDHVVQRHGVVVISCGECAGNGCGGCSQTGVAFLADPGWDEPCGPGCPLHEARPV